MEELPLNLSRLVRIWWAISWRCWAMALGAGLAFVGVQWLVVEVAPGSVPHWAWQILALLAFFGAWLWALRMALKHNYDGFRLAIVADQRILLASRVKAEQLVEALGMGTGGGNTLDRP